MARKKKDFGDPPLDFSSLNPEQPLEESSSQEPGNTATASSDSAGPSDSDAHTANVGPTAGSSPSGADQPADETAQARLRATQGSSNMHIGGRDQVKSQASIRLPRREATLYAGASPPPPPPHVVAKFDRAPPSRTKPETISKAFKHALENMPANRRVKGLDNNPLFNDSEHPIPNLRHTQSMNVMRPVVQRLLRREKELTRMLREKDWETEVLRKQLNASEAQFGRAETWLKQSEEERLHVEGAQAMQTSLITSRQGVESALRKLTKEVNRMAPDIKVASAELKAAHDEVPDNISGEQSQTAVSNVDQAAARDEAIRKLDATLASVNGLLSQVRDSISLDSRSQVPEARSDCLLFSQMTLEKSDRCKGHIFWQERPSHDKKRGRRGRGSNFKQLKGNQPAERNEDPDECDSFDVDAHAAAVDDFARQFQQRQQEKDAAAVDAFVRQLQQRQQEKDAAAVDNFVRQLQQRQEEKDAAAVDAFARQLQQRQQEKDAAAVDNFARQLQQRQEEKDAAAVDDFASKFGAARSKTERRPNKRSC